MSIDPSRKHPVIEPAVLKKLGKAYDDTIEFLEIYEELPLHRRELLAQQMITLAQSGERDMNYISQRALAYLSALDAATTSLKSI